MMFFLVVSDESIYHDAILVVSDESIYHNAILVVSDYIMLFF